jgi:hypothetical protein
VVLVAEGGVQRAAADRREPFQVLFELMVVIEALCPVWPQREVFRDGGQMKL